MKKLIHSFILLALSITAATLPTGYVLALTRSDIDSIYNDTTFYDADSGCGSVSASSVDTNNLTGKVAYFIGDSLTIGEVAADLLTKAIAEGLVVDSTYRNTTVNGYQRYRSKSVDATIGYRIGNTIDNLKQVMDDSVNRSSQFPTNLNSADVVVVGLGTNSEGNFADSSASLVTYLRSINSKLTKKTSILWVNTNYTSASGLESSTTVNERINTSAEVNNFTVLNIAADSTVNPDGKDGIHYTHNGYKSRAKAVIELMKKAVVSDAPTTTVNTPVLSADDNHKYAWDFLVNKKGLSPNAAAGLMGNLHAESGINPQRVEGKANARGIPDGPELPIDAVTTKNVLNAKGEPVKPFIGTPFRGSFGYGIAQWTTASRQEALIGTAKALNKPSGSIEVQLEHLWSELESKWFDDVLAVLQNPNVGIAEASDYVLVNFEAPGSVIYRASDETYEEYLKDSAAATTARRNISIQMFDQYSGSTYTGPSITSSSANCVSGSTPPINDSGVSARGVLGKNGAVDELTGYAFPMEPQNKAAVGGMGTFDKGNGVLNSNHGGGEAFDLFGPGHAGNKGGDDVYAFDSGVIAGVGEDDPGWCQNIQLQADDGYYYWYGHLNYVNVKRGQRVEAGQVMGETAQWTNEHTCDGSSGSTHLHIDRGCTTVENGVEIHHWGGRQECRDPAFISLLKQIYDRLK